MSSLTTDAERNCVRGLSCSVNVPVCRSKTATPAVTPGGTTTALTADGVPCGADGGPAARAGAAAAPASTAASRHHRRTTAVRPPRTDAYIASDPPILIDPGRTAAPGGLAGSPVNEQ
ncbi:hypothetical protein JCM4814A_07890 [Streptomyces phaeofaciens JCM 4814]